jgi:hypothetical protein
MFQHITKESGHMRRKRLGCNEYVDEYGNVRRVGASIRQPYEQRSEPYRHKGEGSSLIADLAVWVLKAVWFVTKSLAKGITWLLRRGAKNLSNEWGKPKPIIPDKKR